MIISGLQPFALFVDRVPGPTQSTAPTLATISQAVGPEFEYERERDYERENARSVRKSGWLVTQPHC